MQAYLTGALVRTRFVATWLVDIGEDVPNPGMGSPGDLSAAKYQHSVKQRKKRRTTIIDH
jgi:hypothetical protein